MNAFVLSLRTGNGFSGARLPVARQTILLPAVLLLFVCQPIAFGQLDDFNDGDDSGWVRYNPLGTATFSFPTIDNFGGKAYRIQTAASPNASFSPGRASGYRTNTYDDFYAAVDLAAWDNALNQAFGLIFRAGNIGLGTTTAGRSHSGHGQPHPATGPVIPFGADGCRQ